MQGRVFSGWGWKIMKVRGKRSRVERENGGRI
jgi:hypothetical protein